MNEENIASNKEPSERERESNKQFRSQTPITTNDTINGQIGEPEHEQTGTIEPYQNGEPQHIEKSDGLHTESSQFDDISFEDKYFPLIISNIGSYELYKTLYLKQNTEIIGRGAECIVYRGINIKNGECVAIQETILKSKAELIYWFAKYLIIKQCNFYQQYDAYIASYDDDNIFTVILVQELLDQNITQIMTDIMVEKQDENEQQQQQQQQEEEENIMNEKECKNMIRQIVEQLNILTTTHNYLHLDIKPTNIMRKRHSVNDRKCGTKNGYKYTLIDFGYTMECDTVYNGYLGTKEWSPPEMKPVENGENQIYESHDMWSIGLLIIYCLFNGLHPFCYKKRKKQNKKKVNNKQPSIKNIQKWYNKKIKDKQCFIESYLGKLLIADKISYNLFDFLFKCLRFDPNKRLTPNQALKHKWLQFTD